MDDRDRFFSQSHAADKELKSSGSHISMLLFKPPNQSTKSNDYLCQHFSIESNESIGSILL